MSRPGVAYRGAIRCGMVRAMRDSAIPLGLLLLTLAMPGCDRGEVVRSETQPEAAVPVEPTITV